MPTIQQRIIVRKREILEQRLDELLQEYQSVTEQMGQALSNVDVLRLERQENHIDKQIAAVEAKLAELEQENIITTTKVDQPDFWSILPANVLDQQQRRLLEDLFESPPLSDDELRDLCHAGMPSDQPYQLAADADTLELLGWLLEKGKLMGDQVPLLYVLKQLLPKVADNEKRKQLQLCSESIARYFAVSETPTLMPAKNAGPDTSVLMLELCPHPSSKQRYTVQAWLFHNHDRIDQVYVQDHDDLLNLENKQQMTGLITRLRAILAERGVDEKSVLVEFILPQELLLDSVEHWTNHLDEPIGTYSAVVVRSRDRLRDVRKQMSWESSWKTIWNCCRQSCHDNLWWMKEQDIRQLRGNLDAGRCIALHFVPDLAKATPANILERLLSIGTPIAIWPRQGSEQTSLTRQFRTFTKGKSVEHLPATFRDMRYQLWAAQKEDSLCYHMTLLWDDPNRRIPDYSDDGDGFLEAPI